ncbi:MAG: hypothetical protein ACKVT0_05595 [Planctomycetaceae bacterium]
MEFVPSEARASMGMTDASGVYTLQYDETHPGAALGEHTVRIATKLGAAGTGGSDIETVPTKYNEKSEQKVTVTEGDNTHNFDLTSK